MSEDNNVSKNVETQETTNVTTNNVDTNVVLENATPNENTQFVTPSDNAPVETKKKSKLLPILLVLIVALCICLGGFYFYFSTPKKIVATVINKAYSEYDKIVNKDIEFDIKKDSLKIKGDLNIDTNIDGFKDLKEDTISFTGGIDYDKKKAEGGIELKENNKTLVDVMAYIINNSSYISLGDDYKGLINSDEVDFDEILDLDDMDVEFDKEDINYVVKAYKDILIDSIDEKDLDKTTDTIKIDGKDTKVNKVTYKITSKRLEKLSKNIINATLKDEELLERLAKITDEDVDDIKDSLKESKDDLEIDEDIKMSLVIYTKGFTNSFAGLTLKVDDDNSLNIVANKDDSVVTIKSEDMKAEFTVKEYNDEKVDIDYKVKMDEKKVTGNLTVTAKETKKNNYKGSIIFSLNNDDQKFKVTMNYTMEIGASIADINTNKASDYDDDKQAIDDALETIKDRIEKSNLGDLLTSFSGLLGNDDDYYDYDYSDYYSNYDYSYDDDDDDDYDYSDYYSTYDYIN